ncbi:hypothetical protein FA13DRAFT_1877358, partial [Coprinellus micaceus]
PALGCTHPRYRKDAERREPCILRGRRRAVFQGRTLGEVDAGETGKKGSWGKVEEGSVDVGRWSENGEHNGKGRRVFVMGDEPVFSDFAIAATFADMRNVWGEDHARWKEDLDVGRREMGSVRRGTARVRRS